MMRLLVCWALCGNPTAGWFGDGIDLTPEACLAAAREVQRFVASAKCVPVVTQRRR